MRLRLSRLIASAILLSLGVGFTIVTNADGNTLGNAMMPGSGITLLSGSYTGASVASGTFSDGPFGISSGTILTSGRADGATVPGSDNDNAQPGYMGGNTFDAAVLSLDISISPPFTGFELEFAFASNDYGGNNDALRVDVASNSLTTIFDLVNPFMDPPYSITPPNSLTKYDKSSPPVLIGFATGSGIVNVKIAVYDLNDGFEDSAALIRMRGCVNCPAGPEINYETKTVTVTPGEAEYFSTVKASGTATGYYIQGVYNYDYGHDNDHGYDYSYRHNDDYRYNYGGFNYHHGFGHIHGFNSDNRFNYDYRINHNRHNYDDRYHYNCRYNCDYRFNCGY
ncbi:hypothetical protein NW754_006577 [Fusarium falciforme]|nr:hypothetical protein NW754_006577 [Fusarium falciforme]